MRCCQCQLLRYVAKTDCVGYVGSICSFEYKAVSCVGYGTWISSVGQVPSTVVWIIACISPFGYILSTSGAACFKIVSHVDYVENLCCVYAWLVSAVLGAFQITAVLGTSGPAGRIDTRQFPLPPHSSREQGDEAYLLPSFKEN